MLLKLLSVHSPVYRLVIESLVCFLASINVAYIVDNIHAHWIGNGNSKK
jgi:hypothetical protein